MFLQTVKFIFVATLASCTFLEPVSKIDKKAAHPQPDLTAKTASKISVNHQEIAVKIMPLGDSITDGYNVPGGYRINLWKQLVNRGLKIDFVGSLSNGPNSLPDRHHEGHSGWKIDEIHQMLEIWLKASQPNVVLLMIGTNDIAQNDRVETAPQRLNNLIDKIFNDLPEVEILVASIPPIDEPSFNSKVREYNEAIALLVENRQKQGARLTFVDINSALNFDDLADGVHPNSQGHNKMANVWEQALISLLGNK